MLTSGVATPQTLVTCPPTWRYSADYLFRNYMDHSLPGLVGLAEAMAFSCNTTFMPLSYEVYLAQETALTDTLKEFGFGAATGIGYADLITELGDGSEAAVVAGEDPATTVGGAATAIQGIAGG